MTEQELINQVVIKWNKSGAIPSYIDGFPTMALRKCLTRMAKAMNDKNYSVWQGKVTHEGKTYTKKMRFKPDAQMRGIKKHFISYFKLGDTVLAKQSGNLWRYKIRNADANLTIKRLDVTNK